MKLTIIDWINEHDMLFYMKFTFGQIKFSKRYFNQYLILDL